MYGAARMDISPSSWSKPWSYSSLSCNKIWEWGLCHILSVGESARWSEQGAHLPPLPDPLLGPYNPGHFLKQGRMPSSSQAYSPLMMLFEKR